LSSLERTFFFRFSAPLFFTLFLSILIPFWGCFSELSSSQPQRARVLCASEPTSSLLSHSRSVAFEPSPSEQSFQPRNGLHGEPASMSTIVHDTPGVPVVVFALDLPVSRSGFGFTVTCIPVSTFEVAFVSVFVLLPGQKKKKKKKQQPPITYFFPL
jgi:hypothetical protein